MNTGIIYLFLTKVIISISFLYRTGTESSMVPYRPKYQIFAHRVMMRKPSNYVRTNLEAKSSYQ